MDKEFELHTTPREILICADSHDKGVLSGRLFFPGRKAEAFSCLTQCLLRIDSLLNEDGQLQSFTEHRTFREPWLPERLPTSESGLPQGALATFHLQVLYRRNSSWQGKLAWTEQDQAQSFRSVLELMTLIESCVQG